ncbi:MAG: hypothetical protein CMJ25_03550 [Phycisphaerae bacterium]|nr:hypothetical protein [Phycisphaerae bacterium]|tara:strand:- start:122 stop:847 length:726 start_codon:yes stop_codon:yes gene_type:complete
MSTETIQMEGNITGSEAPEEEVVQERPEWLPEKFKSPEDMAKAYGELEKEFTKSRQEGTQVEETESTPTEDAKEAVESVGLNFESMSEEYMENGELSSDTYAELESKGIPKNIVDAYIQGQQSIANNVKGDIFNSVGGEENYTQMTEWAADNMNQAEKDAFNLAVNSGDMAQAKLAVEALNARYKNMVGVEPNLVGGRPSESVDTYQSWAQVTTDMKNPAYSKDPAFRATVEKKLGRSKLS